MLSNQFYLFIASSTSISSPLSTLRGVFSRYEGESGEGHVRTHARGNGLGLDASKSVERATVDYRWSRIVAYLFVVSASVALWTAIFLVVGLITG
jgi:hypothetical protein